VFKVACTLSDRRCAQTGRGSIGADRSTLVIGIQFQLQW